jgi:predicted small integral membrane protein
MNVCQRLINIGMMASIALFFSVVVINNIVDFNSNWQFVQHVLSMDTTFREPTLMQRAITHSFIQISAYYCIIAWECLTALMCWVGTVKLFVNIKATDAQFNAAKTPAFIGLFFGFLLYMVGFIIIGGEWFSMWQSTVWNGQMKAGLFVTMILFVMIILKL